MNLNWNQDILAAVHDAAGFDPSSWILVGPGVSREEIKALLLNEGLSISGPAIQGLSQLAASVLRVPKEKILDQPFSRQEILRALVDQSIRGRAESELRRHRRQRTFFKKLDRAVQSTLLSFSTDAHRESVLEFIRARSGDSLLRSEILGIATGYVAFVEGEGLLDPSLLLLRSAELLESGQWNLNSKPEKIAYISAQSPQGLENRFLEALESCLQLKLQKIVPMPYAQQASRIESKIQIDRWHSIEDAAYATAEKWVEVVKSGTDASDIGVVISDTPSIRRSLMQAFKELGCTLEDSRDPTVVKRNELVKRALLQLEVVGRGFKREDVLKFETHIERIREIQSRGIRARLESYKGGRLSELYDELSALNLVFGQKLAVAEIKHAHLKWISDKVVGGASEYSEVFGFFQKIWESIESDWTRLGWQTRKMRTALWVESLSLRIAEAAPPVVQLKNKGGVRLYRLQQMPAQFPKKAIFFGLASDFISGAKVSDHFLTQRDREMVRNDFDVRSARDQQQERQALLKNWITNTDSLLIEDFDYDWDGSEREGCEVALLESDLTMDQFLITEKGPHPRYAPCFDELQTEPPQQVQLPFAQPITELKATELEAWTRCPFRGLTRIKWKLDDLDEPEMDLRAIDRGIILHEAIKYLLNSRDEDGVVRLQLEEAIERAWQSQKPRHFFRGKRLEQIAKKSLMPILTKFMEAEFKYFERTKAKSVMLDNQRVESMFEGIRVFGQPDRVDAVPGGLFVMDFKSGQSPSAKQMVESGYRLQLPFYAVAAQKSLQKRVTGLQFITLDKKGTRSRGIFFSEFNKKEGNYYYTKANKNVLDEEPEVVLKKCEENIESSVALIKAGEFSPVPKIPPKQECPRCPEFYLCGRSRVRTSEEDGVEE